MTFIHSGPCGIVVHGELSPPLPLSWSPAYWQSESSKSTILVGSERVCALTLWNWSAAETVDQDSKLNNMFMVAHGTPCCDIFMQKMLNFRPKDLLICDAWRTFRELYHSFFREVLGCAQWIRLYGAMHTQAVFA